ncbi:hypothetical protein ACTXT7_015125 [Hymenolepis weldensis]
MLNIVDTAYTMQHIVKVKRMQVTSTQNRTKRDREEDSGNAENPADTIEKPKQGINDSSAATDFCFTCTPFSPPIFRFGRFLINFYFTQATYNRDTFFSI